MALRTFIRLLALALAAVPLSFLFWDVAGPLPALVGLGLIGMVLVYLLLLAGGGDLTRWQLRYHLIPADDTGRLEELLYFLAEKAGYFVVEAGAQGLFLELPAAFDRYVEAQLPKALPELRLARDKSTSRARKGGSSFFSVGLPGGDLLRWATEGETRQVRLHIHHGPYATLVARTDRVRPPGRWIRIRLPHKFWQRLPLWDELSAGIRLSSLFPPTGDGAVYSSQSRLLQLAPPDDYAPDPATAGGCRTLGQSADGRLLTLGYGIPLHTVSAPASFLVRQAVDDLATGRAVVVISPHRRILERIAQQAGDTPVHWLDSQNSHRSVHLSIVSAEQWATMDVETVLQVAQTFLADLGLDVELPHVGDYTHRLLHALAVYARTTGQDLTFTDLHTVSQSTQALRVFLVEAQNAASGSAPELLARLDDDGGYVQAVTILSAIRIALKPLGTGSLHMLCQPPFLDLGHVVGQQALLLVPMTNADFPEHDRLLSAMLDLTLNHALTSANNLSLSLHLHDPHLYREDRGRRWIDAARQDSRISLLSDVHDPDVYRLVRDEQQASQVIFHCSETLSTSLIADWRLPASAAELTELPTGVALARLPGMVVTLKVSEE
jgi:hypothetical protein